MLTDGLLTSGALNELLPGGGGVRVCPQHLRGLEEQQGRLLHTIEGGGHILLKNLVLTAVNCVISNLYNLIDKGEQPRYTSKQCVSYPTCSKVKVKVNT